MRLILSIAVVLFPLALWAQTPVVTSFNPTSAGSGTTITLMGTDFTGATDVSFGGVPAASFVVLDDFTITAVVDNGASGDVSVTTAGGTGLLAGFTFIPAPTIISFLPTSAASGATVTITGTDFTDATAVSFGGTAATSFIVVNATTITAVVATGSSGNITVTTPGGTAILGGFIYDNVAPTVVVSSTATDPTNVSPIPVTITFSESVTGFVLGDITVTNGTASAFAGSGTTYTVNITPSAAGPVTVSVAANVAADAASNGNTASNILSRTFDNVVPTVLISSTATEPTSTSPIPVTITFSESVTGFALGDITVTNGTAGTFAGSGTTYTANITPSAAGPVTVSVVANVAADAANNTNTSSNLLSRTYDNGAPTAVVTSTATDPTNLSPIPVTITFSESVTGLVVGDITVTNGTASAFAGGGTTYTASITPSAAGPVTVSVAANVAADAASNGNTASNILSRTYDNVAPTVVISSTATDPTNVSPIPVTITFSESVTGFILGEIVVTNGTASAFAGSGTTYTASITPSAAGPVTVNVAGNVAADAASNGNTASNILSRTYDNVAPTVVISSTATDPTSTSPIPVTITFSESVTGFVLGDITVTNGTAGAFAGSGTTYTANITPSAAGPVTVSVAANLAADAASNGNTASNVLSRTYDNGAPTAVVTSTATEPTNVSPIPVTITFSESVTGLVVGDITVTNGTVGAFAGSGTTYTASITPSAAGPVTVSVAANVAADAASNGNTASNILSRTYDNSAPTVVISSTATDPTSSSPIPVTITFSESVSGFVLGDITVTNGTAGAFAGSGTTYTANITPSAAGPVTVSVAANVAADAASNGNTASNILSRTYDNGAPTVVITSTATEPTNVSPIPVTITFSESVTGFVLGDITVTNGTAGAFAGSGTTYTANITPTAAGPVTVSVAANVAADAASNTNTASNVLSRTYDNGAPTAVITSTATEPTNVSPIPVTITFSESVTGFVLGDITVTNGTAGAFAGSGTNYTASITPSAAGPVTVSVAGNVAADAASNGNTASNILSRTYDNVAPTVVISSTATDPTSSSPIPVTITFSESVTGFIVGEIIVTNGTASAFAGSGTTYTASITPSAAGPVTVSVAGNVAADAASNGNTASNILSRTYDNVAPTVVISSTATDPTNVSPIPVTITFSEGVTGFEIGDITITNGTAGDFAGSGTTYTANITPSAAGLVTVSIAANVAVDVTSNGNTASNILSRTYDNVAPTVVITSTATEPTNVSPIPVTITFSESITGLVVGDITVTNGTAGAFAGSGTTYTASITPTAAGPVTVSLAANVAADAASNTNTASNMLSRNYDNVVPTVIISSTATDPTNVSPIPVTITFSESITGFIVGDITVTNGTASAFAGSGTTYTASITPTAAGPVTVSVAANVTADAANNTNTASNVLSRTYDNVVPTVVISSTATDPTNLSPFTATITFSEGVTGFEVGDITVTNGTAGTFAGSGTTYTASITPTAAGPVTVSVAANVAVDGTSNGNTASNILSRTYDNVAPSVVITSTAAEPTNVSPIPVTITFSESVTGFVLGEITVTNGTASAFAGSGSTYTANITPTAVGPVTVSVVANVATDAASNGNTASAIASFTYIPTTITSFTPTSGAIGTSITITGTGFSTIPGNNIVTIKGVTAVVAASTTTSITTSVPAGSTPGTGTILITVGTQTATSATNFTVLASPTITGFSPSSGAVGATVTITGTNFTGTPNVTFNGVPAIVTSSSATSITTTVPVGAGTGPITVTTSNVTISSSSNFTVLPSPTISGFSPDSGAIGATITISGTNFSAIPANNIVRFNGTLAVVTASTPISITTTVPAAATTGTISVGTSGVTVTSSSSFTVLPTPTISGFSPASGAIGATVTITGNNFSTTPANNVVTFNGVAAGVIAATATSITTTVPLGALTGPISLTLNGVTVNGASNFVVLPSPSITGFSPSSGAVSATVTITGTNFSTIPANNVVRFNGTLAVVTGSTATSIIATVPFGASTGAISVTTSGVTVTSSSNFTVLPPPSISGFSPASGAVGATVTILGNNFSAIAANNIVRFSNNRTAVVSASTSTSITVTVPASAVSGVITVTVSGVTVTSSGSFTVLPTPTITGFSPTGGISGTTVTITGTNFNTTPTVEFNGIAAVVTSSSQTSITTSVPDGAGTGPISVSVSGVTINSASNFTVFGTPSITGFSPNNGAYGVVVVITGTNFSAVPSENTVEFNGTASAVTSSTITSITTTVPFGATTGPISVTVNGITGTSSSNFTVPTPVISGFTPTSGAVGATVTITGSNFHNTDANNVVKFNDVTAVVTTATQTSITTTVPNGATTGKITVTVGGITGTSATDFIVLPTPTFTSFTPSSGAVGATVALTGTNFNTSAPENNVIKFFNNITAQTLTATATSLTTKVPTGATTGKISIATSNITLNSATNFTVLPTPTVTSFSPSSAAVGAIVTIVGTNFNTPLADNQVSFNGIVADITSSTPTSISAIVPSGAVTGPISIIVNGVAITTATNFTVLPTPTLTGFTPSSGAPGATVIITGTHFSTTAANNAVKFNGVNATEISSTTTSITVTVPNGATTGKISITTNGVTISSSNDFTVLGKPTIAGFTPPSGAVGAEVIITGTNFSEIASENVVDFNGVVATVTTSTSETITTKVPSGASTGKISVTASGVKVTSVTNFVVMPTPFITSFTPASGLVGSIVNIIGINFDSDESKNVIMFNGTLAETNAASSTAIITTVPAGATSGPISVTVNGVTVYSTLDFIVDVIDVTPPILVDNKTPLEIPPLDDLRIEALFEDEESEVVSVSVIFQSTANRGQLYTISLVKIDGYWVGNIPSGLISELGVEYRLIATNRKNLTTTTDFIPARILHAGFGLTIPYTSFGSDVSNYRIISIPLDLDNPAVSSVFDELPPYDRSKWRISHYDNATNSNKELTPTTNIKAGEAYWLIIKDNPLVPITTGAGKTVDVSAQPFTIQLKAGWNQIGNPYNFNLQWSDLVAVNPGLPVSFRAYNGVINNFENKTFMNKMEGGFVNVESDMQLVYPVKKCAGCREGSASVTLRNSIDQDEWDVDFVVKQGDISNLIGGVGMRLNASEDFDIYDGFSMPRFSKYLDVNHDKKLNQYHYSKDVIPTADNHTWNFRVEGSESDKLASISWDNSYLGTNDLNLILFDEFAKVWVDMKEHNSYSFAAPSNFKVLYGSKDYIKKEIGLGNARILEVSPNPAKGPINIHLFLPEWQTKVPVQLELKSLTGITLSNIFTGELESGYQKFEWSGENNSNPLPSGVYLIQMRCNNTIQTVRVVLLN